ncbi:MAG: hypothetical protein ABWY18_14585 [Tardiphaga sp.]
MTFRPMIAAAAVLTLGFGAARAEPYKPGDFLLLDLQKAVLSPTPIGPPAAFEHVQIEARSDSATPAPARKTAQAVPAASTLRTAAAKPRSPARARVARSRGNPLDANASDTRVQTWPCRSGGICNWQR